MSFDTTCRPTKPVIEPIPIEPRSSAQRSIDTVWYAAYGSNMHLERLRYYIEGGRPPGGARAYPGCRDRTLPIQSSPVALPGAMYFALESQAWTGGMAFYDPIAPGSTAARAYLVTLGQFSDIAAQEMYHEPGADLDLQPALAKGRMQLGPGRYQTMIYVGELGSHPVLTFTAPWTIHDVALNRPAARYLRYLASGLVESHGWSLRQIAEYLAQCPGAAGQWSADEIEREIIS